MDSDAESVTALREKLPEGAMNKLVLAMILAVNASAPAFAVDDRPTCQSMFSRCRAECPAAEARGAPKGCTCQYRLGVCKQTKVWPSWRAGSPGMPVR